MSQSFRYQIGGSLAPEAPSYIPRIADDRLNDAIAAGEFSYVFNSRQMGKSSLLAQTLQRCRDAGYACTTLDMTRIGGEVMKPSEWYKGIVSELWRGLGLRREVRLKAWWDEADEVSLLQNLGNFIDREVLDKITHDKIVIFIDEIDSVLTLPFPVDDLFALIRFCYNQRSIDPRYDRLCFALFGVAKPSDLIRDRRRTPFNIGQAIELGGLSLDRAQPLAQGFADAVSPNAVNALLAAILDWTGGQPFLTQKLCDLVRRTLAEPGKRNCCEVNPAAWVANLVQTQIVDRWDAQDEPEHLRTIRDRLIRDERNAGRLLGLYQHILLGESVVYGDTDDLAELLLSGVIVRQGDGFAVKNPIYACVFNSLWIEQTLQQLRPYAKEIETWLASGRQDRSRLLRGQTLGDAQTWSQDKRLGDEDYQFLAASVEDDRQMREQALEAARTREAEARLREERQRLEQEHRNGQLQRLLLRGTLVALVLMSGLGITAAWQYWRAVRSQRTAQVETIRAQVAASNSARISDDGLEALASALAAKTALVDIGKGDFDPEGADRELSTEVDRALRSAVFSTHERNQLQAHPTGAYGVVWHPNGGMIASGGEDGTVKLWASDGRLLAVTPPRQKTISGIIWTPDGQELWTTGFDGELWRYVVPDAIEEQDFTRRDRSSPDPSARDTPEPIVLRGERILSGSPQFGLAVSPDGDRIATGSHMIEAAGDRDRAPQTLNQNPGRAAGRPQIVWDTTFTPDGRELWQVSDDTITRYTRDGDPLPDLMLEVSSDGRIYSVAIAPDGQTIATSSNTGARLWSRNGQLLHDLPHDRRVWDVAISPDGTLLATASDDGRARLWSLDGQLLATFNAHRNTLRNLAFSPDGTLLTTASRDGTVKFWQWQHPLRTVLPVADDNVSRVVWWPDGRQFATASSDAQLNIWQRDGRLQKSIALPGRIVWSLDIHPQNETIALATGTALLLMKPDDHDDRVEPLSRGLRYLGSRFSPDGRHLLSALESAISVWTIANATTTDANAYTLSQDINTGSQTVTTIDIATDNTIASGGSDGTIRLHDFAGRLVGMIEIDDPIAELVWMPDGETIAIATSGQESAARLELRERNGRFRESFDRDRLGLEALAVRADGQQLAVAGLDRDIELWQLGNPNPTLLSLHTDKVRDLAFSPDGAYLLSASEDTTAVLWNLDAIASLEPIAYTCRWLADYLRDRPALLDRCNQTTAVKPFD